MQTPEKSATKPKWEPLCKCMQIYCEPFFAAMMRWSDSADQEITQNRIQLIETAKVLFDKYSEDKTNYTFELVCQYEKPLLDEVLPSAGKDFKVGGDNEAYETVKKSIPPELFGKGGVFFQSRLLKPIAGWNEMTLLNCNVYTRRTLTLCVEKLFRIRDEAGLARFIRRRLSSDSDYLPSDEFEDCQMAAISAEGGKLFRMLRGIPEPEYDLYTNVKNPIITGPIVKKKKAAKKKTQDKKRKHENVDSDDDEWTKDHETVGWAVAAEFPSVEEGTKLYVGRVVSYAPPSLPDRNDQLYHIQWEDGDEQDYDEHELQKGLKMYEDKEGWQVNHELVGKKYAQYFPDTARQKAGIANAQIIFEGRVTAYAPPDAENEELFHVLFTDNDEADYSRSEIEDGIELFKRCFVTQSKPRKVRKTSARDKTKSKEKSPREKKSQPDGKSKKKAKRTKTEIKEEDDVAWTTAHPSVGKQCAQYFDIPNDPTDPSQVTKKLYVGTVKRYAPPSRPGEEDQLYHVLWEDDDEQDFDKTEMERAFELYHEHMNGSSSSNNNDGDNVTETQLGLSTEQSNDISNPSLEDDTDLQSEQASPLPTELQDVLIEDVPEDRMIDGVITDPELLRTHEPAPPPYPAPSHGDPIDQVRAPIPEPDFAPPPPLASKIIEDSINESKQRD